MAIDPTAKLQKPLNLKCSIKADEIVAFKKKIKLEKKKMEDGVYIYV